MPVKRSLAVPGKSNVVLKQVRAGKAQLKFPRADGHLEVGRDSFDDQDDLLKYLAATFPLAKDGDGRRFTVKRAGKYQRVNAKGDPVFTFGDPVLDLITDEHGWIAIGGQRHNLAALELAQPGARTGGIATIDLSPRPAELDHLVARSSLGEGGFSIVAATGDQAIVASTNPSTYWFYSGTAKMRFRAFKKNYYVGWKMGADIETWNGDFTRAEIQSDYGYTAWDNVCVAAKHDSDSDTNDDYVDEYEWGVASSAPTGVRSICTATWKGSTYSRVVTAGGCDYWL
jgi:hypothetical protein